MLDYNYFIDYYKIIAIDLSKQHGLDDDPKATQQINFTRNLAPSGNAETTIFFITEEAKETVFQMEPWKKMYFYFALI